MIVVQQPSDDTQELSVSHEFGLVVVGAMVLAASLLWKDLILDIEDRLFPKSEGMTNRILFTIILTLIFVILIVVLRKIFDVEQPA